MKTAITYLSVFLSFSLVFSIPVFAFQQNTDAVAKATAVSVVTYAPNNAPVAVVSDTGSILLVRDKSYNLIDTRYKAAVSRLKQKAASVQGYVKANNFSTDYVFLVDMSIPSGKKRFFIYNMKADSLEYSSLVAHGFGSTIKESEDQLAFSNNNWSFKTSLGKYRVGTSYNGTYGLAYKLYGLDSTNSRAYERAIVLHSETHVPMVETYPEKICQSAGCPMVAPSFLPILGNYIKASKKPILLWIYN